MKNGKNFDWQAYDDRISQQPGRGSLTVTKPRDEDLGIFIFKIVIDKVDSCKLILCIFH